MIDTPRPACFELSPLPFESRRRLQSISFDDLHIQDKTQPGDHDPAAAPSIQRRSADVPDAVHDTPDTPRDSSGATTPNSMSRVSGNGVTPVNFFVNRGPLYADLIHGVVPG